MANSYTDYSLEELISMKASIEVAIGEKKRKAYNEALQKVLDALKVMADNYPYEDAIEIDDEYFFTWRDLYDHMYDNVQAPLWRPDGPAAE